ncbi:MAG: AAA family ATPase, partial [Bacteroidota bacterium]
MKDLPLDIQSIETILKDGRYVYVDKTAFAYQLITGGVSNFFLSRPRRFGKSLFIDTLAEIFKGNKELFKDCAIYQTDYDWQPYIVLRFDFLDVKNSTPERLEKDLEGVIENLAKLHGVTVGDFSAQLRLKQLITELSRKGKIVILVDEYDKPIADNLQEPAIAAANRRILSDFFGIFKSVSKDLRFVFVTGISKFAQVSLSASLSNLKDLTMQPLYAAVAGYTEEELKH